MPRIIRVVDEIDSIEEAQRAFLDWLCDFEAVDDAEALLAMLVICDDELPNDYCSLLGLSRGSTFADAAGLLGGPWGLS
jgi:hypothetical protein